MCLQVENKAAVVAAAAVTEPVMAQAAAAVLVPAAAAVTVQDTAPVSTMASAPALRAIPRCLRA